MLTQGQSVVRSRSLVGAACAILVLSACDKDSPELQRLRSENSTVRQRVSQLEQDQKSLQTQLQQRETELIEARAQRELASDREAGLRGQVAGLKADVERLNTTNKQFAETIAQLAARSSNPQMLEELKKQMEQLLKEQASRSPPLPIGPPAAPPPSSDPGAAQPMDNPCQSPQTSCPRPEASDTNEENREQATQTLALVVAIGCLAANVAAPACMIAATFAAQMFGLDGKTVRERVAAARQQLDPTAPPIDNPGAPPQGGPAERKAAADVLAGVGRPKVGSGTPIPHPLLPADQLVADGRADQKLERFLQFFGFQIQFQNGHFSAQRVKDELIGALRKDPNLGWLVPIVNAIRVV